MPDDQVMRCESCGWPYHEGNCRLPPEEMERMVAEVMQVYGAFTTRVSDSLKLTINEWTTMWAKWRAIVEDRG